MRVLTVPNWSFGRNRELARQFQDTFDGSPVTLHYCQGDVDHNRTVTAFSGEWEDVRLTLLKLVQIAFEAIDLNRHIGVHPRIGALDVCPFIAWPSSDLAQVIIEAEQFAEEIARRWDVPIYLYEKSEKGRHEADLPTLRKGGFGALILRQLKPDFGPGKAHPRLGVTVLGVRDFLIAMNVNLDSEDLSIARRMGKNIREMRTEGDQRFLGVRALGLPLASREQVQVSMNLTLPDLTPADPILEWVQNEARKSGVRVTGTELIGVIRQQDLPTATRLPVRREQVVF